MVAGDYYRLAVVSRYIHIVRHGDNALVIGLRHAELTVIVPFLHLAAEFYLIAFVASRLKPYVASFKPIIREFELPAVDYLLLKNSELIADRKSRRGKVVTRKAIKIAGG